MQGHRPTMEDAHVIHAEDTWGFFGIFDGHGGDQCSRFISKRISEELGKTGMPDTDKQVTDLACRLDKEVLDSNQPGGSTGTFVVVQAPKTTSPTIRANKHGSGALAELSTQSMEWPV
ncbi:unnamed protein product [Symbiodinium pilosum]|uniref:PPM-type phosphatase domain-containing protein n=1 Tax=Symbiodinium pilosum TaxID=2952 RepID=A0A812VKZ0_SYMPI|nr:unnamed protein product [Symbiodinium pilosum]